MRLALRASGVVQGVGFRPWVMNLAGQFRLSGWVRNTAGAAEIEAQGSSESLRSLVVALKQAPSPIRVDRLEQRVVEAQSEADFRILPSDTEASEPGSLPLSPDLAICSECAREVVDPEGRRHRYAFTSCARCGPRYSIVRELPFDRSRTTMDGFQLCPNCDSEYRQCQDRRFHAQTLSCPQCGPALSFEAWGSQAFDDCRARENPLDAALEVLRRGLVLGVMGVGGFQLLVDATRDAAVQRLRARKQRPSRPFAVLFEDVDSVLQHCSGTPQELELLRSPEGPILLLNALPKSANCRTALSKWVAPGCRRTGVLLPTTPLHYLLAQGLARPVVCTSGNQRGEPMISEVAEAREKLRITADALLFHDRPITHALDDSVGQVVAGRLQLLRRARGYVPGPPIALPRQEGAQGADRVVLALGGHQKSTVTLAFAQRAHVGPHLGDLNTETALAHFTRQVEAWCQLHRVKPTVLVCDWHEHFGSSRLGVELADRWGIALQRVQHHHAHIAACMAEHGLSAPVLGLAWDGAGWGGDGTLWGGEMLRCEGVRCQRLGSLRPFRLPGGEAAMREPRRSALGLLHAAGLERHAAELSGFSERESVVLWRAADRGLNAPLTSSVGRLFDAAVAIAGLHRICDYEGQAASTWMGLAEESSACAGAYEVAIGPGGTVDWLPLLMGMIDDHQRGVPLPVRAWRFHAALANTAIAFAEQSGLQWVALSGGCFQNRLLVSMITSRGRQSGLRVLVPERIPPNDAGLSLGQAYLGWLEPSARIFAVN